MKSTVLFPASLITILCFVLSVNAMAAPAPSGDCPVPAGLTTLSASGAEAVLAWDALPGAEGYAIEVENDANGTPFFHLEKFVGNVTQFTVTGLMANGSYKFKVRSYCNNGDHGDWTAWVSFNSSTGSGPGGNGGACSTPTNLAVAISGGVPIASWTAVSGATGYAIEVEDGFNNPNSYFFTTVVTGTSVALTGLLPDLIYKVKVRTVCGSDHSSWSAWAPFNSTSGIIINNTGGGTPNCPAPDGLNVANLTNTSALLTWNNSNGALFYTIEVEQVQGPDIAEQTVSTNSFQVNGLAPSTVYKFKVRSRCGIKNSSWSPWFTFTTPSMVIAPSGGNSSKISFGGSVDMSISPNPVGQNGSIQVAFNGPANQDVTFKLISMTGKTVQQNSIFNAFGIVDESIQVGLLPKGLYFVQAVSGSTSVTSRIFVTD